MTTCPFGLGDKARFLEGLSDLWIEVDGSVVVVGELVVSDLAARHNPVLEVLTYAGVDNVTNVASRHLPNLP